MMGRNESDKLSPAPPFDEMSERKMSLETRPRWRPVAGFPAASTAITEHRKHNPFADLNSYASGVVNGRKGYRPLDAKGIGAKPVQAWKEMLRGAHSY